MRVTALKWHLGVCRAEVDSNIQSLSAGQLCPVINESIQFFSHADQTDDEEDNDDDVGSSDTASSTDSDISTNRDDSTV